MQESVSFGERWNEGKHMEETQCPVRKMWLSVLVAAADAGDAKAFALLAACRKDPELSLILQKLQLRDQNQWSPHLVGA